MTLRNCWVHVIDDDASWRTSVQRLLSAVGYRVALYESAEKFLATADLDTPGCILLDMRMPGLTGLQLQQRIVEMRHKLPIVLIVGNDAGWGLERELQSFANPGAPTVACELRPARYDLIMKAFGGEGETIERLDQVRPAIGRAFASGVPYCLNVKVRGVRSPFTEWQIAGKKK